MSIPPDYLAALRKAQRRLQAGDPRGAIQLGEQLIRVLPKHPGVHVILAHALNAIGQTEQALARYRSAAELAPKDAARWEEFVGALYRAGQKGRARNVAQKAPLKGPEKKKLLDLARNGPQAGPALGGVPPAALAGIQSLLKQGRASDARNEAEMLLQAHPESAALTNLAGVAELALGDFQNAETQFARTLEISPDFVGAAANLGLTMIRQNRLPQAISILERAVNRDTGAVEPRKNLALACLENRSFMAAVTHAEALLELRKDDPDGLTILASAFRELKRFDAALGIIDRLESLQGRTEATLTLRFDTLADAGRIEEAAAFAKSHRETSRKLRAEHARLTAQLGDVEGARQEMASMIAERPDDLEAYYRYGLYTRWRDDDPLLPGLRKAAAKARKDDHAAPAIHYALSKAEFDLGRDAAGFAALDTANAWQGRRLSYDHDADETQRMQIEARWTAETLERLSGAGDDTVAPIFIVGAPRSGSTLIEHVIAAHPQVTSVGEDTFAGQFFPIDMAPDRETLSRAAGAASREFRGVAGSEGRLLDKYLHNYWRLGILAAAFPRARFVETRRDPRAVAFSIYSNQMSEGHAYATDLAHIAGFYLTYHRFMEHWRAVLGERLTTVEYESIVGNPEPGIRRLIGDIGLRWDDTCLRPEAVQKRVKTLSVAQVRSGIHQGSVERWRRVEADLAPFSEVLVKAGLL